MPLSFYFPAPDYWGGLSDKERGGGELTTDLCYAGGHYFIHGLLQLPILGRKDAFTFGVWVSLSEKNFERVLALWKSKKRQLEPPYFGWFSNSLPMYPETLTLKTHVHTQPVGLRPLIELEPTDHPLAVEQRQGISYERAQELVEAMLHPE